MSYQCSKIKEVNIPPRSPFGLIQEDLWPDNWKILIACIMLNCTTRKSVEKILPSFFTKWPNPHQLLAADPQEISEMISPLGFKNRRTKNLLEMTRAFVCSFREVRNLPGIGEYAARAWEIFCLNDLGESAPKDHALTKYWHWRKKHDKA